MRCTTAARSLRAAGGGVVVALLLGCGGSRDDDRAMDAARTDDAAVWVCRTGTQGGFTGGGDGTVVHSDGRVQAWVQDTADSAVELRLLGIATDAQLAPLRQALAAPELDAIRLQESGNLTAFVEILDAQGRRRWSWPAGSRAGRVAKVPPRACFSTTYG